MKLGKVMMMELKNRWKGLTIFSIVILLLIAGLIQAHPSIAEGFEDKLEGQDNIEINMEEEEGKITITLSWADWAEDKEVDHYTVLMGRGPSFTTPLLEEDVGEDETWQHTLLKENDEIPERYFGVVAHAEGEREFVGMETSSEDENGIEDIWGIDISDIRGMISMLWGMWWFLLIGLYLGYVSVNSVSQDFEERRMDIIFSTPLSKRQYLMEKFSVLSLYMLGLLAVSGLVMIAGVSSVGELDTVSSPALFLSSIFSLPVFMVIIAASILAAVYFEDSKKAVGFSFLIILVQYGINVVVDLGEAFEYLEPYTIISYWNHESILFDEIYHMGDFFLILILSLLIVLGALLIFERKDIPA